MVRVLAPANMDARIKSGHDMVRTKPLAHTWG